MLSRFWCNNCKWDLTINLATQPNKCPRCKCGVSLDFTLPNDNYMSATPRLGNTNGGKYPNKIAPIYGPGVNFGLNKKQSGTRLNSPNRRS